MIAPSRAARSAIGRKFTSMALAVAATGALGSVLATSPAQAQFTVFDPTNYSQNLLTAARSLQQINNQIQSLQHEASMLLNQAKNLTTINFPEVQAITQRLQQIDQLMSQARGIQFHVTTTAQQYSQMFPSTFNPALTGNALVAAARARLDASLAAFGQTMSVQSQIAENVSTDAATLNDIVSRSQSSEGALAVGQATNQLLALAAKQQFQTQSMMAAQYRAEAIEQARRVQMESDARAATQKFLGSGSAYTPAPPGK
ncbi:P-type conjugative transfer protein TrbJ [Sphingomonas sp. UYEF23]|uniref:P-type conjugative transfer protein TrbJ n=1 Tax=Sphingomonas sp. UYEF23 TaxID=1756408 RepID=UPI0033917AC2